jgi:hypothetical protein
MLADGVYGLRYTAVSDGVGGDALAVLRDGKVLGSDPCGGVFVGSCEFDAAAGVSRVRLRFDVPPEGALVTGFAAGPSGAVLDIEGAVAQPDPEAATIVVVAGAQVAVHLTYLGPLPE